LAEKAQPLWQSRRLWISWLLRRLHLPTPAWNLDSTKEDRRTEPPQKIWHEVS
jgi:hypothetical protein